MTREHAVYTVMLIRLCRENPTMLAVVKNQLGTRGWERLEQAEDKLMAEWQITTDENAGPKAGGNDVKV